MGWFYYKNDFKTLYLSYLILFFYISHINFYKVPLQKYKTLCKLILFKYVKYLVPGSQYNY